MSLAVGMYPSTTTRSDAAIRFLPRSLVNGPAGPRERESETVTDCERFSEQRCLPVDPRVDPSGRVHMWAHLKIAQGGGPTAPRVYFYDDTRGPTGKVHVGFIGPHRYMENTKTN